MQKVVPHHIGIIIDGNRRWAKARHKPSWFGHQAGYENLKNLARYIFSRQVKILTIYAFSTENWKRDKKEVGYLLRLIRELVEQEAIALNKDKIKLNVLGNITLFDKSLQKSILAAQNLTKNNKQGTLNICLSYGGRAEILYAISKIIKKKEKITEANISNNLFTAGQPDPDLIIRTSGEQRLSNFLTWQSIYSELYFSKKMWPEFNKKDLDLALREFNKRQRRFGK